MSYIGEELIFEEIDGDRFILNLKSDTQQSFTFDISNSSSFLQRMSYGDDTVEKFIILLKKPISSVKRGCLWIASEEKDNILLLVEDSFEKRSRKWKRVFKFGLEIMPLYYESYTFQWTRELSQTLLDMLTHIQKHSTVYNIE